MDIAAEELEATQSHGFRTLWAVYGDYAITGGVLRRARDDIVGWYAPATHLEIPGELAKLTRGDEAAIIRFAKRYGQLGHDLLVHPEEARGGDPVGWIWRHAETIKACLRLTHLLREEKITELGEYLRSLPSTCVCKWFSPRPCIKVGAKGGEVCLQIGYEAKNTASLARLVRRDLINPNLDGIYPQLAEDRGQDQMVFRFHALIEVAYWHLASTDKRRRVLQCKDPKCGALFVQSHRRQQHCPPQFRQKESSCAVRVRVAKLREKNKNKQPKAAAKPKKRRVYCIYRDTLR
jgi:hypothetical protein